jgi:hypothetical protein
MTGLEALLALPPLILALILVLVPPVAFKVAGASPGMASTTEIVLATTTAADSHALATAVTATATASRRGALRMMALGGSRLSTGLVLFVAGPITGGTGAGELETGCCPFLLS